MQELYSKGSRTIEFYLRRPSVAGRQAYLLVLAGWLAADRRCCIKRADPELSIYSQKRRARPGESTTEAASLWPQVPQEQNVFVSQPTHDWREDINIHLSRQQLHYGLDEESAGATAGRVAGLCS